MILVFALLLGQVGGTPTARQALERIQAKTPVEVVSVGSPAELAGRYTSASKEAAKRAGPMPGGFDIYLFPDGTFMSCNWTDVSPLVVFDKGSWTLSDGLITLASDRDVAWDPSATYRYDRRYVVVQRGTVNEALLLGVEDELRYFENHAGDDPSFMLLVVAKKREATFTKSEAAKVKARLIKQAWRPEFFKEKK